MKIIIIAVVLAVLTASIVSAAEDGVTYPPCGVPMCPPNMMFGPPPPSYQCDCRRLNEHADCRCGDSQLKPGTFTTHQLATNAGACVEGPCKRLKRNRFIRKSYASRSSIPNPLPPMSMNECRPNVHGISPGNCLKGTKNGLCNQGNNNCQPVCPPNGCENNSAPATVSNCQCAQPAPAPCHCLPTPTTPPTPPCSCGTPSCACPTPPPTPAPCGCNTCPCPPPPTPSVCSCDQPKCFTEDKCKVHTKATIRQLTDLFIRTPSQETKQDNVNALPAVISALEHAKSSPNAQLLNRMVLEMAKSNVTAKDIVEVVDRLAAKKTDDLVTVVSKMLADAHKVNEIPKLVNALVAGDAAKSALPSNNNNAGGKVAVDNGSTSGTTSSTTTNNVTSGSSSNNNNNNTNNVTSGSSNNNNNNNTNNNNVGSNKNDTSSSTATSGNNNNNNNNNAASAAALTAANKTNDANVVSLPPPPPPTISAAVSSSAISSSSNPDLDQIRGEMQRMETLRKELDLKASHLQQVERRVQEAAKNASEQQALAKQEREMLAEETAKHDEMKEELMELEKQLHDKDAELQGTAERLEHAVSEDNQRDESEHIQVEEERIHELEQQLSELHDDGDAPTDQESHDLPADVDDHPVDEEQENPVEHSPLPRDEEQEQEEHPVDRESDLHVGQSENEQQHNNLPADIEKNPEEHEQHAAHVLSYNMFGADWGATSEDSENRLCHEGRAQSPIYINDNDARDDPNYHLQLNYVVGRHCQAVNNGHAIQITASKKCDLGYVIWNSARYDVKQFHFHTKSEHRINGQQLALEGHIVHQKVGSSGTDDLLVLGVLFQKSSQCSPFLGSLHADRWPTIEGEKIKVSNVDFYRIESIRENGAIYGYDGSLTTPPCSENVNWNVLKTPLNVCAEQLAPIERAFPEGVARQAFPLGNRALRRGFIERMNGGGGEKDDHH